MNFQVLLWVEMPRFPIKFLSNKFLGDLGNLFDKTILIEPLTKLLLVELLLQMLIDICIKEDLVKSLDIVVGELVYT